MILLLLKILLEYVCINKYQPLREEIVKSTKVTENPLTLLLRSYVERNKLSNSFALREYVGELFIATKQHDASEFFMGICSKSVIVKNVVEHKLTIKIRCRTCQYTTTDEQPNNILVLTVPRSKKVLTLQEIIEHSLSQWRPVEGRCNSCGELSGLVTKTSISAAKKVLILQLIIMSVHKETSQLSKIEYSIKGVPSTTIAICGQKYKVKSAIFHHGQTIFEGHYTSMLRVGTSSWILADDAKIQKKSWPRNAKKSYMFFLEHTKR